MIGRRFSVKWCIHDFLTWRMEPIPNEAYRVDLLLRTFTVISYLPIHLVLDVTFGVSFVLLDCNVCL